MYKRSDYIRRALTSANNYIFPGRKRLSTLMIYGTDICDSRCKHCLIWAKRPVKFLPKEKIIELMQNKCITKKTKVGLEGGEFLLHPEAFQILKWFKSNHPNFDLLSNSLKPENLIETVKKYKPRRLFMSLDGNRETYQYMRGKDGYDNVLTVINKCKDIVPISVMFTLSPYNSFEDLDHVISVCHKYGIDIRVGIYNDIDFFDTIEKAHETEIAFKKNNELFTNNVVEKRKSICNKQKPSQSINPTAERQNDHLQYLSNEYKSRIPRSLQLTSENYDFVLLYDEWRKMNLKIKCYSILDSIVVHPNGDVPICQNLELKLGNIYQNSLDEIINSPASQKTQNHYVHNCNQCWVNFHRKFDIVMLRTLEKYLPKKLIEIIYGKYQWCFDKSLSYTQYMSRHISNTKLSD